MRWGSKGIEYEADPRHREVIMEFFGFEQGTKGLSITGERDMKEEEGDSEPLSRAEAKEFRGLAARMNYLAQDSPDLQFPIKQVSREMANPTRGSWKRMKKVARYIISRERVVWEFKWQGEPTETHLRTDSDWGGDERDRRSTSGGYLP